MEGLLGRTLSVLWLALISVRLGSAAVNRPRRRGQQPSFTARVWLRVCGERRYPGRLVVDATRVLWIPRLSEAAVDLTGSAVFCRRPDPRSSLFDEDELGLDVPSVGVVWLTVGSRASSELREVLRTHRRLGRSAAADPRAPSDRWRSLRRWWPRVLLVLAGGWFVGFGVLALTGASVDARVLSGSDGWGFCTVGWVTPGGVAARTEIACADPPDDPVRIRALGAPFEGVGGRPDAVWLAWVEPVVLLGLPGAFVVARDRRFARRLAPLLVPRARREGVPLPPLTPTTVMPGSLDVTAADYLARLVPYVRHGRCVEWVDTRRPGGAGAPVGHRDLLRALRGPLLLGLVALAVAVPQTWGYLWRVGRVLTGSAPDQSGFVERMIFGGPAAIGAAVWLVVRCWRVWRARRAVGVVDGAPTTQALGLLTADDQAEPVLLLVDPAGPPTVYLMRLHTPLPAALMQVEGPLALSLHGVVAPGEPVVPELATAPGTFLAPATSLSEPSPRRVCGLVDGAGGFELAPIRQVWPAQSE